MCGGGGGGYNAGQASRDREQARLEAEQQRLAAENMAQQEANAATAARRVRARSNTLMTRGAQGGASVPGAAPATSPALTSTIMARGASVLGGTA